MTQESDVSYSIAAVTTKRHGKVWTHIRGSSNNSELDIETTAPIRIVSETVTHKKVRYVRK